MFVLWSAFSILNFFTDSTCLCLKAVSSVWKKKKSTVSIKSRVIFYFTLSPFLYLSVYRRIETSWVVRMIYVLCFTFFLKLVFIGKHTVVESLNGSPIENQRTNKGCKHLQEQILAVQKFRWNVTDCDTLPCAVKYPGVLYVSESQWHSALNTGKGCDRDGIENLWTGTFLVFITDMK